MSKPKIIFVCGATAAALAFAAAIPAASGPGGAPRFLTFSAVTQATEALAPTVLVHSRAVETESFPDAGAGRVRVVIRSETPSAARTAIEAAGGRVERSWRNLVQAVLPATAVASLSRQPSVGTVRAPFRHVEEAVNGEEVTTSLAASWHAKGFTGKGVKVAIIDGGFAGLAERQASGDLPGNVVTQDFCGGKFATADDHGTAVAEIVHEMAPDAQLYLLCIDTEVDLANAEAYAKGQGVSVINHSIGWFGPDRGDGSGPIGAVVADARSAGILWVNSAGNEATTHWSGTFSDSNGDGWHDFAAGDIGNTFIWPNDSTICGFLKWDEWPTGRSDFDLYLGLSGANVAIAWSTGEQTGSQSPYEELCMHQSTGSSLQVFWAIDGYSVTTNPRLDLFSWSPSLQYQTAAGSIGEPATSPAAFAVGALCWQSRQLEFYSSQGPTIDGRTKPDIAGHDSVSNATYGASSSCVSTGFAGTSASSPEVVGAAALVKQVFPAYGPDQLQQYLMKAARDLGTPGVDNETGAGELQLPAPPDLVKPSAKAMASSGKPGKIVKLVFAAGDDSGKLEVVDRVRRNGKVVASMRKIVNATSPKNLWVPWKAPAKPKGTYQHCVVGTDAAGNASAESCAKLALR